MTKKLSQTEESREKEFLGNKEQLRKEVDRVKNSVNISFDDYLKYFIGLNSPEEYGAFVGILKKQKINDFPDLFSTHLDKSKQKDIGTKVEPLVSSNTMYMNIFKHIQLYKYKQKLYSTTTYDSLLDNEEEEDEAKAKAFEEAAKIVKEFINGSK